MFATQEHFSRAAQDLFDAQAAFLTHVINASMDAGMTAAEQNVESLKTMLASATVATRQWLTASNTRGWTTPVLLLEN